MHITFKLLRYKNILSTGNAFTEINLDAKPKTILVGSNGAGKSTVLDALYFVLYGKPFRDIKKGNLVNSVNRKGALVELTLSVGAQDYKVIRGIKPDKFEIYQSDSLIDQNASIVDYQKQFEHDILQMDRRTFAQVVILGSANYKPFMQLSTPERREVVENLLDLKVFAVMNSMLKEKVQSNKAEVAVVRAEIELQNKFIASQKMLMSKSDINIQVELDKINLQIENLKDQAQLLLPEYDRQKVISELTCDIDESQVTSKNQQLRDSKRDMAGTVLTQTKLKTFYAEHTDCPTCHQSLTDEFRAENANKLAVELDELKVNIENIEREQALVEKDLVDVRTFNSTKHSAMTSMHSIMEQLKALKWKIGEYTESKKKIVMPVHTDGIQNLISEASEALGDMTSKQANLLSQQELNSMASVLLKDDGIKSCIIAKYIPILNSLINKYLGLLGFYAQFEIDENFNEKIKSRFRDEFEYNNFSEGEKLRIDIAILFAWRELAKMRNSASSSLLLMDEVLDRSIDADGANEFLKLVDLTAESTRVMIISHRGDQLAERFDRTLSFEKQGNYSVMSEN